MKKISNEEKTDILLILAQAFEKKFGESAAASPAADGSDSIARTAENSFAALGAAESDAVQKRAAYLDELPEESFVIWQEIQLNKLRRRGRAMRLDENINSAHIAENLSREPKAIRNLILKNLPADLSKRIIKYLELYFSIGDLQKPLNESEKIIDETIVALIKRKFLANFVAFEDIFEPNALDKFSIAELEDFIRQLGLREMAIACRGITSKETLAAFLNRFNPEEAREIVRYITELDKIKPFWVAQADELVRRSWRGDFPPEKVLRKIGLKLLAFAYAFRDETARRYASQKLSAFDAENWRKMVDRSAEKLLSAADEERVKRAKRQKSIERLAAKFAQTGRL